MLTETDIAPEPCTDCGGIVYRWDVEGVQRCVACDPGLREYALAMLEEVQTQPREQHDWNWFLRATRRKGYKLSWARAQYRRVIGKWPPRTLKWCPADPKSEDWQRKPADVYPEFWSYGKQPHKGVEQGHVETDGSQGLSKDDPVGVG